jgi:hypothetical protein
LSDAVTLQKVTHTPPVSNVSSSVPGHGDDVDALAVLADVFGNWLGEQYEPRRRRNVR